MRIGARFGEIEDIESDGHDVCKVFHTRVVAMIFIKEGAGESKCKLVSIAAVDSVRPAAAVVLSALWNRINVCCGEGKD